MASAVQEPQTAPIRERLHAARALAQQGREHTRCAARGPEPDKAGDRGREVQTARKGAVGAALSSGKPTREPCATPLAPRATSRRRGGLRAARTSRPPISGRSGTWLVI